MSLSEFGQLERAVRSYRTRGCRVVLTNGCFDILHVGHLRYLREARALGDVLVVGVNSDDSVRQLKGPGRPVNRAADRVELLAGLSCVDCAVVFADLTPARLILAVRPDVYVKGGDYSPEMLEETAVVRAFGGEVRIVGYVPAHSTTELVERIRAVGNE